MEVIRAKPWSISFEAKWKSADFTLQASHSPLGKGKRGGCTASILLRIRNFLLRSELGIGDLAGVPKETRGFKALRHLRSIFRRHFSRQREKRAKKQSFGSQRSDDNACYLIHHTILAPLSIMLGSLSLLLRSALVKDCERIFAYAVAFFLCLSLFLSIKKSYFTILLDIGISSLKLCVSCLVYMNRVPRATSMAWTNLIAAWCVPILSQIFQMQKLKALGVYISSSYFWGEMMSKFYSYLICFINKLGIAKRWKN